MKLRFWPLLEIVREPLASVGFLPHPADGTAALVLPLSVAVPPLPPLPDCLRAARHFPTSSI